MRTFNAVAFVALIELAATQAAALDATRPAANAAPIIVPSERAPLGAFKSDIDAFRNGIRTYNEGDKVGAVRALEYAATKGHAPAAWKLGRMYADGDGVAHDDLKAFEYFSRIATAYAAEGPEGPNARFVSNAFVALGGSFLEGIPNSYVKANPSRAYETLQHAATHYGDADAQYALGRFLLDGRSGQKNPRHAAKWLNLAAEKGHAPSQAVLGHLLISGQGIPRQVAIGLMWLTLAKEAAVGSKKDAWIIDLHTQAIAASTENDRAAAKIYLEQHMKGAVETLARQRSAQ